MNLTADDKLDLARQLRRSSTNAENKLWAHLCNRRPYGLKFKRQGPVCGFVDDFLCDSAKLIVVWFWNNDVMSNIEGVLSEIAKTAGVVPLHPNSLPLGEGVRTVGASSPLPRGEDRVRG